MLGDSAGFLCGYVGLADRIQKRSLAVINMAHYADNRRSGNHICLVLFILFQKLGDHIDLLLLLAENVELHGDLFCLIVIHFLVYRHHLAFFLKELANDHRRLHLHLIGQLLNGNGIGKGDYLYFLFLGLCRLLRHDKGALCRLSAL